MSASPDFIVSAVVCLLVAAYGAYVLGYRHGARSVALTALRILGKERP